MAQKRRKNKKNKKLLSVVLFLVLFVVAGVVMYFVWNGYFRENKKEDVTGEVGDMVEIDQGGKGAVSEEVIEKEPVVQYEGDDPNKSEDLTGVITYAGVSGDNLMIRVNIDQYLDGGSCELSLIQSGVKYNSVANISSVTTATCEGFDVPLSELGSGNYQIIIKLNSSGKIGAIEGGVNL